MSIASIAKKQAARHADPTARAVDELAIRETLGSALKEATRTYGATVASEWMEKQHGEPPTVAELEAATIAVARENLADLRASNPFAAAYVATANPVVAYATGATPDRVNTALREAQRLPSDTPSPLTASETFSAARARVAAEAPEANAARDAWAHAGKHMNSGGNQ